MKSKIELTLTPTKCVRCDKSAGCYFGRFFKSLKTNNCRFNSCGETCQNCSAGSSCVMKKFENVAAPFISHSKSNIICENID